MTAEISYGDFAKLDIRIGTVLSAEVVPGTDKLIKCVVDFGDAPDGAGQRTIVSGIAQWRAPESLVGKQFPYVVNLAPRTLRGIESAGMLLAAAIDDGIALLSPDAKVKEGARIR